MLHAGQSPLLGCCSCCLTCTAGVSCMSHQRLWLRAIVITFSVLVLLPYPMVGEMPVYGGRDAGMRVYIRPARLPRFHDMHC